MWQPLNEIIGLLLGLGLQGLQWGLDCHESRATAGRDHGALAFAGSPRARKCGQTLKKAKG